MEDVDCHHPLLAHHQRVCPSKRKDQHVQATTLVGLEIHVDMHVALLLLSYSTDVMCQKKRKTKKKAKQITTWSLLETLMTEPFNQSTTSSSVGGSVPMTHGNA